MYLFCVVTCVVNTFPDTYPFCLHISRISDLAAPSGIYKPKQTGMLRSSVTSLRFSSSLSNDMLFTAALSILGLGSSLVAASPLSDGGNAPALVRACGSTPSDDFIAKAEAHFADNKVNSTKISAAVTLNVYCTLDFLSFLCCGADTAHRACDLQYH